MRRKKFRQFVFGSGGVSVEADEGFLDVTGAQDAQIEISGDGTVMWIHIAGRTIFRMCRMEGGVKVTDLRDRRHG